MIITKTLEKQLKLVPQYIRESATTVLETAKNITEIKDHKKLSGYTNYYRKRIGNYRMDFQIINPKIIVVTILHCGTIY
ncbi:MAG: type II toxin-antitoxin system RelE family toxin [Ferruginibacter sp.]